MKHNKTKNINMKATLFYLFFVPFIVIGQTSEIGTQQTEKSLKYELGFNLYSLTDLHKGPYTDNTNYVYNNNFFTGIFVKKHFNKNAIRLTFDYNQKVINQHWESTPWFSKTTGDLKTSEIRLGYERNLTSKKIIPFINTDLCYNYSKSTGESTVYGDFWSYTNREFLIKQNEYSFSLGSGLKIILIKNLVLTYEFNIQAGFYQSRDIKNNPSGAIDHGKFTRFNPVRQLGLSIKF